jgi:hypothetical protein
MTPIEQIENILNNINEKEKKLLEFQNIIAKEYFSKFQNIKKTFEADSIAKMEENRLLRIGIVGQIKRGKSSFINALLFHGDDILPKGATPMTAALTKIHYAKEPYAILEFYSIEDWKSIEQTAKIAQKNESNSDFMGEISEEEEACLEIYTKAKNSNILDSLGKKETIKDVQKIENLLDKLEEFVGVDGKFTPIVKSLELGVNIDSIKDIEIIDTPGTNDPVISRGRVTQDFMGQCDVVFFLSMSSQFLDQNDMQLLAQNIPNKGVQNIYLVGSLFDSAMLDTYKDYDNISDLIENLKHKYTQRAKEEIQNSIDKNITIANSLLQALPPLFISAMSYNIATHYSSLSEEEAYTLENLNTMYNDNLDDDDLYYIANIDSIEEKIENVKIEKEEILKNAFSKVVEGVESQIVILNNNIRKSIKSDLEMLQNNDVVQLEKKQQIIQKSMQKGAIKIDNVFTSYIIEIEKSFASLMQKIKNDMKSASGVKVETGSYTVTHTSSRVTNSFTNFFNDDWGRESSTTTETIYYKYANVYDAIEQLEEFVRESEVGISKTVENIIDIKLFRKEILQSIVGLFDMKDDAFDPNDIIDTLRNSVNRISIPNVDIDTSKHIETVRKNFSSSEVRDDEIDSLKEEVRRVLSIILKDMKEEVQNQTIKIIEELELAKEDFLPKLLSDSYEKLEQMKKNRDELEATLHNYQELMQFL